MTKMNEDELERHSIRAKYGDGHPEATTYTAGFTDTLDYIFFNKSYLKLARILKIDDEFYSSEGQPTGEDSQVYEGGVPNSGHSSDHVPLYAEFEMALGK